MRLLLPVRAGACAILAAGLLTACGKGTPLTSGTATPAPPYHPSVTSEYPIPTASSGPAGIALGADGNLWFTEFKKAKIGQLNQRAKFTETDTPTANAGPTGIASGPNQLSTMWFTETNVAKIGQIALNGPTFTDFMLSNPAARPTAIALGSDGNMWATDPATDSIWRINQLGRSVACRVGAGSKPSAIASGPDGAMWFTEPGTNRIGRLPVGGKCRSLAEFPIPTRNADPAAIVAGSDNALWFTERSARKLGRIDLTGHITNEYSLSPALTPDGLLQGIDGNFYFTDTTGNQIGRFRVKDSAVSTYKVPTANAQPTAMTLGPDAEVYFTEYAANKLGQFKYF